MKHLAGDFLLQSTRMAQGKERVAGWAGPLCDAGLYGLGTLLIALALQPVLWWLALADFAIHAGIDRGKAPVGRRTRFPVTDSGPERAHPSMPPHLRLPPRSGDDEVAGALSPHAGRG